MDFLLETDYKIRLWVLFLQMSFVQLACMMGNRMVTFEVAWVIQ
jgi:hypothetical protein